MTTEVHQASHAALRAVYDEHFSYVWKVLRRLGVQDSDCQDAVQQVFIVVHRRLGEFRGEAKLTTWLFGICANVSHSLARSTQRRRELPMPENGWERVGDTGEAVEHRLTLERLLGDLPHEQRVAFVAFEVEGMTAVEVAHLTGVSEGTVKSRVRLARESVARRLIEDQPGERSR